MRDGRRLRFEVPFAIAVAALLSAPPLAAQTPIPTLPPLPPIPASGEASTPSPAATPAPAVATPATAAAPSALQPTPRPAPEKPAASEAPGGLPSSVVILLGIGVLVLVATLVVVLTVLLKKPVVINVPSRSAAPPPPSDAPSPAGWTDVGGVHAGQPPAGELETLPGRFVIDDGGEQVELRIFRTAPGDRVETTIGRDPGPPYRHIQLLPASVAAKHAKLVYDRRRWSLINYARANPARVNGEEVEENASRRLVDGDRIEIGEVVMTYHEV